MLRGSVSVNIVSRLEVRVLITYSSEADSSDRAVLNTMGAPVQVPSGS